MAQRRAEHARHAPPRDEDLRLVTRMAWDLYLVEYRDWIRRSAAALADATQPAAGDWPLRTRMDEALQEAVQMWDLARAEAVVWREEHHLALAHVPGGAP